MNNDSYIGVIIQARINSSRLRGKVLKKIGDKTLLEHIFFRLSFLKTPVKVVLATSTSTENNEIKEFCSKVDNNCFAGSEENVLERYYFCAKENGFRHIIRLTADNPFTDIEELDNLVSLHLKENADYSESVFSLPKGAGAEIFSFAALEKSYLKGKKPNHLEHVNEYIAENPQEFKISKLEVPDLKNRPDVSLTIDTLEDYLKACYIEEKRAEKTGFVSTEEAIRLAEHYETLQ